MHSKQSDNFSKKIEKLFEKKKKLEFVENEIQERSLTIENGGQRLEELCGSHQKVRTSTHG